VKQIPIWHLVARLLRYFVLGIVMGVVLILVSDALDAPEARLLGSAITVVYVLHASCVAIARWHLSNPVNLSKTARGFFDKRGTQQRWAVFMISLVVGNRFGKSPYALGLWRVWWNTHHEDLVWNEQIERYVEQSTLNRLSSVVSTNV